MAAARYFRVVGVATHAGADLEISALHLYDGATRVDAAATLTCSHVPVVGSLGDLQDGTTATVVRFDAADVRSGGFAIQWDFGSAITIDSLQIGASSSEVEYPDAITLEFFDGGRWQLFLAADRCQYPGASQMAPKMGLLSGVGVILMDPATVGVGVVLTNGNTRAAISNVGNARGSFAVPRGVWQFECRVLVDASTYAIFGVGTTSTGSSRYPGSGATAVGWWNRTGALFRSGAPAAYSAGYGVGDILGCVVDLDASTISFYKNGVTPGPVTIGLSGDLLPIFGNGGDAAIPTGSLVFELATTLTYPVVGAQQWPAELGVAGLLPKRIITPSTSARVAASTVMEAFSAATLPGLELARDIEFGGRGSITGTVKRDADPAALPLRRRVRLFDERSGLLVREAWSDAATGAYGFAGLDATRTYTVVAYDHEHAYRAVIADNMTPEVPA